MGNNPSQSPDMLVCIPTYNERDNLPRIVPAVLEAVKEASFSLWHKIKLKPKDYVH